MTAPSPTAPPPMPVADYDDGWDNRWADMRRLGPTGRHLRRIVTRLTKGLGVETVLDVGCGEGSLIRALQPTLPARYAGGDFSEAALSAARRLSPDVDFFHLDLVKGGVDRRFDLVLCTDVVEHVDDDDAAFANLAAMTGRYLLVATMQGRMRPFEARVGHVRNYRYGELARKVEATGLRVERVIQWGFPFFSPLYRDLLQAFGGQGTEGAYGPVRRLIAEGLYALFLANSWSRGDYVFVLARRP
jgi:SAM-dependent methyltransferase